MCGTSLVQEREAVGVLWRSLPLGSDGAPEVLVASLAVTPAAVQACTTLLSETERRRAAQYTFARDARRFIVGRARLRQLLAARLGRHLSEVELISGPQGKPRLAGPGPNTTLRFNLSRHDDIAVCALAHDREVGIDVEGVRSVPEADALAAQCFAPGEQGAYQALEPRDRSLGFLTCWTRKEAFVKAVGEGLSRPLDSFEVTLTPGAPARFVRIDAVPGDARAWRMASFSPAPGFIGAVVIEER